MREKHSPDYPNLGKTLCELRVPSRKRVLDGHRDDRVSVAQGPLRICPQKTSHPPSHAAECQYQEKISMRMKELCILLARGLPIRRIRNDGHHFSWLGGADKVLLKRGAISIHGVEIFPEDYLTDSGVSKALQNALAKAKELDEELPIVFKKPKFLHLLADPRIFSAQ